MIAPDHVGHGYGTSVARWAVRYAFGELGLHKLELEVLDINARARKAYSSAGFQDEGLRRERVLHDRVWLDQRLMGITEREWRDLRR